MKANNDNKRAAALGGDGSNLPARQKYTERDGDVRSQKVRLATRAKFGKDWDGKAANDNIAWPLAKALLAEGNGELLKYAMAYRKIYDQAKADVLIGVKGAPADVALTVVHRSRVDEATGNIVYGGELISKAANADIPPTRAVPTNPDSKKKAAPVPRPWTGDKPINDKLDAQGKLSALQSRLGHLCEPFEMACIDGATLQEVGNAVGIANRAGAMGAGRAIVHMALITVRDALGAVTRKDLAA